MFFGPDYRELNNSYTFKVISDWNVANPDVSLAHSDRYEMHRLIQSHAAWLGFGSFRTEFIHDFAFLFKYVILKL